VACLDAHILNEELQTANEAEWSSSLGAGLVKNSSGS